ncbi:MAG: hypothetical protein H7287_04535 [Thermoleophilia bacterium]|nr:hypothetical protein [Thermoleophilia bacterium]
MTADGPVTTTPAPLAADATTAALQQSSIVRWWQVTRFVELAGPDAITFLGDLCTQAVERIAPGTDRLGLLLEVKAHIVAAIDIYNAEPRPYTDPRRGDQVEAAPRLLLETLPEQVEPLVALLTKYRLRAKVTIESVDLASVAVVGAAAVDDVARALLDDAAAAATGQWFTRTGRDDDAPVRTWIGDPQAARTMVELLAGAGIGLADPTAFEAARIAAGTVSLHDLLAGRMPAEVGGVEAAVALDAGCYLGQEPVVRLHFRGRANRTLRQIVADAPIAPGSPASSPADADAADVDPLDLFRTGPDASTRPVGRLTTWSELPDGTSIGFATLRRELELGDALRLGTSSTHVTVADAAPPSRDDVRAT